jgi:hypothetical protein
MRAEDHRGGMREVVQPGSLGKTTLSFMILLKACTTSWKKLRMLRTDSAPCGQHSEERSLPVNEMRMEMIQAVRPSASNTRDTLSQGCIFTPGFNKRSWLLSYSLVQLRFFKRLLKPGSFQEARGMRVKQKCIISHGEKILRAQVRAEKKHLEEWPLAI